MRKFAKSRVKPPRHCPCGKDISYTYPNTRRCFDCSNYRTRDLNRARVKVWDAAHPEQVRERQSTYRLRKAAGGQGGRTRPVTTAQPQAERLL